MPMNDTVAAVLDQAFAETHRRISHSAQRMQDGADNVAEQTRLVFLEEKTKVGTREAAALQRMDQSKTAQEVLQIRATRDQPQAKPE